ncbi:MAG: PepSY domain-containing protein [Acidobacteriota bacterium]|nr:PepSY domain-containing protein [Acidobacteriota bacterium]
MAEAQKIALTKEPGKLKSKELEKEKGKLIYSFDIKTKSGVHEVNVDSVSGEIVEDKVESAAAEEKEKQQDKKTDGQWSEKPPMTTTPR